MTQELEALGPPPRKAHVRRNARNVRRAYATLFALVILVFGGWTALDAYHWTELSNDGRLLTVGFGLTTLFAVCIYQLVDHPLRRELRLARRGELVQGEIVSIGRKRNRRATPLIAYTFRTAAGATVTGESALPRRFPVDTLAPGMPLDILYDAKKPHINKARLALEFVEFGEPAKKKAG